MSEDRPEIDRISARSPGSDPEDPYADIDVSTLPGWWRRAIREFEEHDLRPYRPPRFENDTPVHEVVRDLEREFEVELGFVCLDDGYRDRWTIRIDGEPVSTVGRHRSPDGYTLYEIRDTEFESLVRDELEDTG